MNKFKVYIQEAFDELMNKTSWPTWNELQSSAIIVAVASLIIGIVVYFMDASFGTILKEFYKLF